MNPGQEGYQVVLNELYRLVEQTVRTLEPMIEEHLDIWQRDTARKCLMDGFCSVFKASVVEKIANMQEDEWR